MKQQPQPVQKKNDIGAKKCITPMCMVSYPNVHTAKAFKPGQDPKYSFVGLFNKEDLSVMKKAADAAVLETYGTLDREQLPEGFRSPFRDGNKKKDKKGYAGKIFVSFSSKKRPGLIDKDKQPILDPEDFYPGCFARAEVLAYTYDYMGNVGVAFALLNVQKLKNGIKISGRKDAEEVFDVYEDESEDTESNYESEESSDGDSEDLGF